MSKTTVRLKLKDMYAIKHALEKRVEERKSEIFTCNLIENHNKTSKEIEAIKKDIEHEEKIIGQFETEISNFEEYIKRR